LAGIGIAIHYHRNSTLGGGSADDRGTNPFRAAGDENHLVLQLKVQVSSHP
jgi:hypothetical protein